MPKRSLRTILLLPIIAIMYIIAFIAFAYGDRKATNKKQTKQTQKNKPTPNHLQIIIPQYEKQQTPQPNKHKEK